MSAKFLGEQFMLACDNALLTHNNAMLADSNEGAPYGG